MSYLLQAKASKIFRLALGVSIRPFAGASVKSYKSLGSPMHSIQNTLNGLEANELITNILKSKTPCMIARFGSTEVAACVHISRDLALKGADALYLWSQTGMKPFDTARYQGLSDFSGFFPISREYLCRFYDEMNASCSQVDLLGSWADGESHFSKLLSNSQICQLHDLEPYYHKNPWSHALAGRKVLVIHPFAETIKEQYAKRRYLYADSEVLPEFELITYPSVQSIAGSSVAYPSWHDALESMTKDTLRFDFDVAILGCGAYGFPLAARLKRAGKQAIHLGGATQILFGIKGKRWDGHPLISKLFNAYWTRPSAIEKPQRADEVEGGCYW